MGMKKVFAFLILVSMAIKASSATCSSIIYFTVMVYDSGISFPRPIWRAPAQNGNIFKAFYNSDAKVLYISFLDDIGNGNIFIYNNGDEIFNNNLQMNSGEVVSYDLSDYDNGEYEINITLSNGITYIGYLLRDDN